MSGEIEVPETPNWLQELEAKRERRLKARLGHEAGAGAPCLKCGEKCPGLDLHFWRKCCKICKCSKEEHEVQDDDIYGWAQFQLLGNKPNKIKRKILLPGKKDELELDWTPKGHNDTVDKYLKTLPPEQLPVKGSQAAQDRKQLLQKQIPIHDIDPTLCHELNDEELKQMNDYISHVKQTSVGVGQIVSLSNVIKANLHMLNPSEAALIASRYPKGIPLAEIVKLHSQSRAGMLKRPDLSEKFDKISLQDTLGKTLPNLRPGTVNAMEENLNPWISNQIRDINYPGYAKDLNTSVTHPQFSVGLKSGQNRGDNSTVPPPVPILDEKFLQKSNFDPKNIPSQFLHQNAQYGQPYAYRMGPHGALDEGTVSESPNSAFVPYSKVPTGYKPGEKNFEDSPTKRSGFSSNIPLRGTGSPIQKSFGKDMDPLAPNFARNLAKYPSGLKNASGDRSFDPNFENVEEIKKSNPQALPNYVPGKYNVLSETQSPTKIPKNVKDLAFSTYDPNNPEAVPGQENTSANPNLAFENYPPVPDQYGAFPNAYTNQNTPFDQNSIVPVPGEFTGLNSPNKPTSGVDEQNYKRATPYGQVYPGTGVFTGPYNQNSSGLKPGQYAGLNRNLSSPNKPFLGVDERNYQDNVPYGPAFPGDGTPYDQNSSGLNPGEYAELNRNLSSPNKQFPGVDERNYQDNVPYGSAYLGDGAPTGPYDQNSSGLRPGQYIGPNSASKTTNPALHGQYPASNAAYGTKPNKKLSELHPGKITIDEDYLQPSQVTIGAIQDINYPEIKAATQGTNDFYEDYSPDSLREILNNVKLPDCHYCKKPFEENEFAITIDRANVLFHAQCFKCAGCNQILADNVYFYNKETDNVYCGRDYAKVRGFPRCKACDELIFTKEYCLAENSTFHLKHFCCIECDKPLAGQDYTLEDEMPYCLPCFEHSKASKCSACGRVIKPDEVGCNLNGVHFHAVDDCFACKMCKKPLMGKKLLLRNEKLYCSHDCFGNDKK